MRSVLFKLFLFRKYVCIYLFCCFYPAIVAAERGGFLYFKFLCYQNPGNRLLNDEICDKGYSNICSPSFKICISNQYITEKIKPEKCNVHYEKINHYFREESVCNRSHDNRKYLAKEIKKELSLPLHKTYFVRIEVRHFTWSNEYLIASFGAEFNQIPSANMSQIVYKDMSMFRTDFRYINVRVSLNISMALQCNYDRYGEYCLDFCKPNSIYIVSCTKDGQRVCKQGWMGGQCDDKDLCAFVSCIKGGQCLQINGKAECWCNNQIGLHCHSHYNPCSNNPCQNDGICSPKRVGEMGYDCQCKPPFSGPQCTNKIDMCDTKPCKNNASCQHIEPDAFHCKCLKGFNGTFCELEISNATSSTLKRNITEILQNSQFYEKIIGINVFLILNLCLAILVIILVILVTACFITKRRAKINKKFEIIEEKKMSKTDLKRKNNLLRHISNEHLDVPRTETAYDQIDETNTYDCFLDNSNEYIVPSSANTLSASQLQLHNSDYMEMSDKYDTHENQSKEHPEGHDSFYLPALPTRELKTNLI